MYTDEYLDEISNISSDYNHEEASVMLEQLFTVKPTRLKFFTKKAEVALSNNKSLSEITNIINNKYLAFYNYLGVEDVFRIYMSIAKKKNDLVDYDRLQYVLYNVIGPHENNLVLNEWFSDCQNRNNCIRVQFLEAFNAEETLMHQLMDYYYIISNFVMHYVFYCLKKSSIDMTNKIDHDWISKIINYGYLVERLNDNNSVFLIVQDEIKDKIDCEILAKILGAHGKRVILVDLPLIIESDNVLNPEDTLSISIENSEKKDDYLLIHPIEIYNSNQNLGDNRDHIIDYICKNDSSNEMVTIFCTGKLMDDLCMRPLMKKQIQRLSPFHADYLEDNMAFGWAGSYTSYIGSIYNLDIETELLKSSECQFSIVIPARNSVSSLRHTLKTCLNQRYQGEYEIVLSDNSTNGNNEVYNLVCEFNNPRIKYYKTPRDLQLSKSFEYAILKTKGEFIITIGSDDALLPWTLEVLSKVINEYPQENIFQWERGFYAWPGFNGGQENEFLIPAKYEKNKYEVYKVNNIDYLAKILNNPQAMYSLPMLYINSGFRRKYISTLLEKTGRLWDGICQDIYMGVINISINQSIMNIKYPLAIAGMTGASVGAASNSGATDQAESNARYEEIRRTNNIGGFSISAIERLMPEVTTDISSLYNSILRAIARGVLPMEYLDHLLDWKSMFLHCFNQLEVTDILFDKKLHYFRYTAMKHGDEFLKWFDETIYNKALIPRQVDTLRLEELKKKKTYQEGKDENGSIILDASKYGVSNVYEAALLFENISML